MRKREALTLLVKLLAVERRKNPRLDFYSFLIAESRMFRLQGPEVTGRRSLSTSDSRALSALSGGHANGTAKVPGMDLRTSSTHPSVVQVSVIVRAHASHNQKWRT